ncbi:hypothetical protein ACV31L_01145 [Clostridium perfringens]
MDHLIDKFEPHIDWAWDFFYQEWKTGNYKKFSECPSYHELKTLLDSVNILRAYIGWERITIKEKIQWMED